jgi:hypothetical protein
MKDLFEVCNKTLIVKVKTYSRQKKRQIIKKKVEIQQSLENSVRQMNERVEM